MGNIKASVIAVIGLFMVFAGLTGLLSMPDEPACISASASPFPLFCAMLLLVGIIAILGAVMVEFKET